MREFVLLLRSGDEADPYEEALGAEGFEAASLSVLAFENVNASELRGALEHPNSYDGLIFTSPRAVEALGEAMPWLPAENLLWHGKSVFAVGPRTARELRRIGFEPEGEESGSAEMLADYIGTKTFAQPLLFLCGNRRRDLIPARLEATGIPIEELVVYRSRPRSRLDWPDGRQPDWAVFFSPSGVEAVERSRAIQLQGVRIAAIGPTTADALRRRGLHVDAVAEEPSPGALALAIRGAGNR